MKTNPLNTNIMLQDLIIEFLSRSEFKGRIIDAHTVIDYLIRFHTDEYLAFHNGNKQTSSFHSRISKEIADLEGRLLERVKEESISKDIRGNYVPCACWIVL